MAGSKRVNKVEYEASLSPISSCALLLNSYALQSEGYLPTR